jgi:hypothetical protein
MRGQPICLSGGAAYRVGVRHVLARLPHMMNRIPFTDPSPDRGDQLGVTKPPASLAISRKAAFQWPPDCAWPFMERKSDSDTQADLNSAASTYAATGPRTTPI